MLRTTIEMADMKSRPLILWQSQFVLYEFTELPVPNFIEFSLLIQSTFARRKKYSDEYLKLKSLIDICTVNM